MRNGFKTAIMMGLAVLVIAGLTGCGKKDPDAGKQVSVDKGLSLDVMDFVPEGAKIIIHLNGAKFRTIPMFDAIMEGFEKAKPSDPGQLLNDYQSFVHVSGIDPKTAIRSMTMIISGDYIKNPDNPEFLMLIKLDYDRQTFLNLLVKEDSNVVKQKYRGMDMLSKVGGQSDFVIAFVDDELIAAGKEAVVKAGLDAYTKAGPAMKDKPVMKKYMDRMPRDVVLSTLLVVPEKLKQIQSDELMSLNLSRAHVLLGSGDFDKGAWKLDLELITNSPETNDQLESMLNSLKAIAADSDPKMKEMMKNFKLTATDESVRLEATLTDQLLNDIIARVKSFQSGAFGMKPGTTPQQTGNDDKAGEKKEDIVPGKKK